MDSEGAPLGAPSKLVISMRGQEGHLYIYIKYITKKK